MGRNYLRNMLRRGVGVANMVLTFAPSPPKAQVRRRLSPGGV